MPSVDIVARLKLAGEQFSSEFSQRMNRIETEARTASARVNTAFDGIKSAASFTVLGLGVGALAAAASRALDYASSLGETSQQLGVTTKDLQVYRYAASQTGVTQEEIDKSLAKLTLTLGKAALGSEKPSKAFAALGIDIRNANGHVKTAGEALPQIADALSKTIDPTQRAAAGAELFGKSYQRLEPLLAGGSAQINELASNAARLGLILDDKVINQADQAADKISEMRQVLDAQFANAIAQNASALVLLADAAIRVATSFPEAIRQATGLARVLENEGIVGYIKSDKTRLDQASTPRGYAAVQVQEYRDAADSYLKAKNGGGSAPAVSSRLEFAKRQRAQALAAIAKADAVDQAAAAPKPVQGSDLPDFLSGGAPKVKAGKSDADREAEQRAKAGERVSKALDEQVRKMEDAARIDRTRLEYGDREADAQEAIARIREQNNDIVGKSIPQLQAAFGWTEEQAKAEKDRVRSLEDAAELTSKFTADEKDRATAASKRAEAEEAAQREITRMQEEQRRRQEDDIRDLASIYRDAFDGGTGSIWKNFKNQAKDAIAEIAARYTIALLAGKSTSASSILGGAEASGSPLGSALSIFRSIGGGGGTTGTISALPGGLGNVISEAGALGNGTAIGGLPATTFNIGGGLGGQLGSIGASAAQFLPPLAAGLAISNGISSILGIKQQFGGLGGLVGNLVGGLFSTHKIGSANLTGADSITTSGNSGSRQGTAATLGGSVLDSLNSVAEQLGTTVGAFKVSIGVSGDSYHVDPTGQGRLRKSQGGLDFDQDQQAAIEAAVADAIKDGAITGISAAAQRLLQSGGDIDQQIAKAVSLESVSKSLAARLDPVGAAIDTLNKKYADLIVIMDEAGASAEQRADAEKLYRLELDDAKASSVDAAESLKQFLAAQKVGSGSAYSLEDQETAAKAALDPFLAKIDAGVSVDQQKYIEAAQAYLDVERELKGSTQAYFDALNTIQAATNKAISTIDNAVPITGTTPDPFAAKTAQNTQTANEIAAQQTEVLLRIATALESGGDPVSSDAWVRAAQGYA